MGCKVIQFPNWQTLADFKEIEEIETIDYIQEFINLNRDITLLNQEIEYTAMYNEYYKDYNLENGNYYPDMEDIKIKRKILKRMKRKLRFLRSKI